ncbi:MAG: hypothetical protein B7Z37_01380 [Verrucomicrobia bacterium 12-59-8]|nr:MAG: hypothetical protein B7Z37_01380 [Verrucomicrobia bacterium 12-59-8]
MNDLSLSSIINACRQADAFHCLLLDKRGDDLMKNKKPQILVRHELQGRIERMLHGFLLSAALEKSYCPLFFSASK